MAITLTGMHSKYTIHDLKPIGTGGNAVVYMCTDMRTRSQYAIKQFICAEAKEQLNEKEVRTMRGLKHNPHVVHVVDEVRCAPTQLLEYIVMDLCDRSLMQLSPDDATFKATFHRALSAVGRLHKDGLIHGDLKPANILLHRDDVKLCDFGNAVPKVDAHTRPNDITEVAHLHGTPYYLAPENLTRRYCAKSDIWSMGVTLYYLTHRRMPFDDTQPSKLWASILFDEPVFKVADAALTDLLKCMLDKEVTRRLSVQDCLEHAYFLDA